MMRYTISLSLATLIATGAALADVPRVATDIPPVHSLVAQVMGDLGAPVLLLDRGADAHDFQLRPSQARALAEAGLVVWMGPEMSPWMGRAMQAGRDVPSLALLSAPGTHLQPFGAAKEGNLHESHGPEDHDDGHGHTTAHDHDHAGHAHDGTDPHAWLDPPNAALWLGLIAAELGRVDPPNAAAYAANAANAAEGIGALEAEVAAILAPVRDRPFVTFHDAYGYFTGHFGLSPAGTIALGDAASPGAARLAELRAGLAGGAALCVFPEASHDPRHAAQLAEATGTRLGPPLDPEGVSLAPGAALYSDMMLGLAHGLADCLSETP